MNSKYFLYTNAQRRSVFERLKEKVNVPQYFRELGSSHLKKLMLKTRRLDDEIRRIALGHGPQRSSFKQDIKEAEKAIEQGRWLDVGYWLQSFYTGLNNIVEKTNLFINEFDVEAQREISKFFGRGRLGRTADFEDFALHKEAGFWDFLSSFSPSALSARQLENMYERYIGKKKELVSMSVEDAAAAFESIKALFDQLDQARSSGNVSEYVDLLKEFKQIYNEAYSNFLKANREVFEPLREYRRRQMGGSGFGAGFNAPGGSPNFPQTGPSGPSPRSGSGAGGAGGVGGVSSRMAPSSSAGGAGGASSGRYYSSLTDEDIEDAEFEEVSPSEANIFQKKYTPLLGREEEYKFLPAGKQKTEEQDEEGENFESQKETGLLPGAYQKEMRLLQAPHQETAEERQKRIEQERKANRAARDKARRDRAKAEKEAEKLKQKAEKEAEEARKAQEEARKAQEEAQEEAVEANRAAMIEESARKRREDETRANRARAGRRGYESLQEYNEQIGNNLAAIDPDYKIWWDTEGKNRPNSSFRASAVPSDRPFRTADEKYEAVLEYLQGSGKPEFERFMADRADNVDYELEEFKSLEERGDRDFLAWKYTPEGNESREWIEWMSKRKKPKKTSRKKTSTINFLKELKKVSEVTNNPYLMASMIAKYSEYLEDTDPHASVKLLKIAHGIING